MFWKFLLPAQLPPLFCLSPIFVVYLVNIPALLCYTAIPTSQLSSQNDLYLSFRPAVCTTYPFPLLQDSLLDQGSRKRNSSHREPTQYLDVLQQLKLQDLPGSWTEIFCIALYAFSISMSRIFKHYK